MRFCFQYVLFAFPGAYFEFVFVCTAEIAYIFKPAGNRNVFYLDIGGGIQKIFCIIKTQIENVLKHGKAVFFLEIVT